MREGLLAGIIDSGRLERGIPLMPEVDRTRTEERLVYVLVAARRTNSAL